MLSTRALPIHPGQPDACAGSLLPHRLQASSPSEDWPLPLASRGRIGFAVAGLTSSLAPPFRGGSPAASSPGRTDPFRVLGYPPTPGRSYMSNEQFTWLTPRSQQARCGLPWRNRSARRKKPKLGFREVPSSRLTQRPVQIVRRRIDVAADRPRAANRRAGARAAHGCHRHERPIAALRGGRLARWPRLLSVGRRRRELDPRQHRPAHCQRRARPPGRRRRRLRRQHRAVPVGRWREDVDVDQGGARRRRLPADLDQPARGRHHVVHGRPGGDGHDERRADVEFVVQPADRSSITSRPTTGSPTGSTAASRRAAPSASRAAATAGRFRSATGSASAPTSTPASPRTR